MALSLKYRLDLAIIFLIASVCVLINCEKFTLQLKSWQFQLSGDPTWRPAQVPSTLTQNLISTGRIDRNLYFRNNFLQLYTYQTKDVTYRTSFQIPQRFLNLNTTTQIKNIIDLQGLDTHCEVFLNGKKILQSNNMYVGHRLETAFLKKNQLLIKFNSSAKYDVEMAKRFQMEQGFSLPQNFSFTRKAAYQYGWDWGPRILTVGIWKPVLVECYTRLGIITEVYFSHSGVPQSNQTNIDLNITFKLQSFGKKGLLTRFITIERENDKKLLFKQNVAVKEPYDTQVVQGQLQAPTAQYIWWTWDLGKPNLLRINITIIDNQTNQQTFHTFITGIRDIKVKQIKDLRGQSFTINLNGLDIFIMGANYIPPQMSMPSTNKSTYQRIIKDAKFGKYNMLRVWGGGQFEQDYFYQLCDREGIMIWHDLMFACALYMPSYLKNAELDQEIAQNVRKIDIHPSIAVWNGNNQVWIGWQQWGWKNGLSQDQIKFVQKEYDTLFKEIIPSEIKKVGSKNFYWETSPSVSSGSAKTMNSGDVHSWRVWGQGAPIQQYEQYVGRFHSEYGMQSFPSMPTIQTFTYPQDQQLSNIILRLHQRHPKGNQYLPMYTEQYCGKSSYLPRIVYYSQIMQQYALEMAIGTLRGHRPFTMGSLYWQLNDVWPCSTWSTVDYQGSYKAAHYAIRRMHQRVFMNVLHEVGENQNYLLYLLNDGKDEVHLKAEVQLMRFNGDILYEDKFQKTLPGLSQLPLRNIPIQEKDKNSTLLVMKLQDAKGVLRQWQYFFVKPKQRVIQNSQLISRHVMTSKGAFIELSTSKLATYVYLHRKRNGKYIAWNLQDNFFNMLPNSSLRIKVDNIDPSQILVTCYEKERMTEEELGLRFQQS